MNRQEKTGKRGQESQVILFNRVKHLIRRLLRMKRRPEQLTKDSFQVLSTRISDQYGCRETGANERVMLVTSNGAGLGHLTRMSAISERLNADTLIYTMSSAYRKLERNQYETIYFPSYGDLGMDSGPWNELMESHFEASVEAFSPDIIVFDGTYIYRGVVNVSKRQAIPLVWMQRGCWKPEVDKQSIQRHAAHRYCDHVIIPEDYGCIESVDLGGIVTSSTVAPITLLDSSSTFSREEARAALNLPNEQNLFLVQLGAGVINDIEDLRKFVVAKVLELGPTWTPVLVENPLTKSGIDNSYLRIEAFPLTRYFRAFDAAIFAGGYNSVQESVEFSLPGIFVPNLSTKTDDQLKRCQQISLDGLGLMALSQEEIAKNIELISLESQRKKIMENMEQTRRDNGAIEAAKIVQKMAIARSGTENL